MNATIDKTKLTDRECILLAYGLLWHAPIDRSSWLGLLASEARKSMLETMDRADQSRGIELAKTVLPSMRPSPPNISPEWDDLDPEDQK